ncbi:MAG: hypothetical protein QNJ47_12985 [Nostocaceae cyanobacterium]|nr:hypothetical protein [Nostocaceae cyanobacterium]
MNKTSKLFKNLSNPKGLLAIALMAIILPACNNNQPEATSPENLGNVSVTEVVDKTAQLTGKTVTVRSKPLEKVGPTSFTVSDEKFFGSEPVLVINASGEPFQLPTDGDPEVQVTGIVSNFLIADVEKEYNLKLDKQYYVEYENKPAIIAKSMALAPEPGEITKNPSKYYGKTLAVTGEVEKIESPNLFTLDEDQLFGAEDLMVLNVKSSKPIKQDETIAVTGVVRPFVLAEFERDYDLTWDLNLKKKLEVEYSNKPVLVTEEIYPSAIPEIKK